MNTNFKIRLGDMFDGPADLIVLPCSTSGTITGFVARRLVQHSIPHPKAGMRLGEVEILPFEGGEDIAQFVAFAASVAGNASDVNRLVEIGSVLGQFTRDNQSVKYVAAPLLGAGAGGIQSELVASALRDGFSKTAAPDAMLVVHVLHQDIFDRLKGNRRVIQGLKKEPVRVFISHTSKSPEATEWVKSLALYLIDQGIQARLDGFHLRRGMDLQQWMCNELAMARKVVVVCDEAYKQKADGRLGGVGWETMIIQGDLAALPPDSTKYQVVVRASEMEKGLPIYLRTRYAFHAPGPVQEQTFRQELVKELLDLPIDPTLETREFALES
jgi:TIR domain